MKTISVRNKVAVILLLMSLLLTATSYAIQKVVVLPVFSKLERVIAGQDLERCVNAIQWDVRSLSTTASDWASWDDSYRYIQDRNKEFERCNLLTEAFANSNFNLLAYVDRDARMAWGQMRDTKTLKVIEAPDVFRALQVSGSPFVRHDTVDHSLEGILLSSRGPMLVASRPIITSDRKGPVRGAVVMGRLLNQGEVRSLAERTRVQAHVWSIPGKEVPREDEAVLHDPQLARSIVLKTVSEETLHAYRILNDVYGKPALLVRADIQRTVSAQGSVAARVASGSSMAGSLVVVAVAWCLLQKLIVSPLQRLTAHADHIARTDDLKARLSLNRADEIGLLAREFDAMVEQLADSRRKMLDVAHQAGMAEIASEVLHNVGNVVNSAGISAELLEQRLQGSPIEGLKRMASLVREQQPRLADFFTHDPRGPKVIEYLGQLTQALSDEHTENLSDVQRIRETVGHIRDIVTLQQSYAGQGDFKQPVNVTALLEDVVRMHEEDIVANGIIVEQHYEPVPELELNKNKLMQVMVNLVKNAVESMRDRPHGERRLVLQVRKISPGDMSIEISDTGGGIERSDLAKIFNHGFTTKAKGHGFGLHFSANAVKDMGATIAVESEGVGRGAKFRVSIPFETPTTAA